MACACKKAKKIGKAFTNQTNEQPKGIKRLLTTVLTPFFNLIGRLVLATLVIIFTPLIVLFFVFHFIVKGNNAIRLPKIFNKAHNVLQET